MAYIRKLGSNRYQIIVHIDTQRGPDGRVRKVRRSKVVAATPREIHRIAAEFEASLQPVVGRPESERTLEAAAQEWLAEEKQKTLVSWKKHDQALRLVILPALGPKTPLRDLRPAVIQALYDKLPPRRCRHVHMTLRALLRYAVRRGWMSENPLAQVTPPRYRRPASPFFTEEEWTKLLATLRSPKWARWYRLVAFLATVPIRPGKALGLTWDDIDWQSGVVWIRRALRKPGRRPVFGETKTAESLGARAVDRRTLALLRLQRIMQARERAGYREWHNLVFTATDGSPLNWDNWRRRVWKELLKEAGLEYRKPYSLRHTGASLLGAAGISPNTLQQRLGHASIQMTLGIYRHVLSTEHLMAAELASKLFLRRNVAPSKARVRWERARERVGSENVTEQPQE